MSNNIDIGIKIGEMLNNKQIAYNESFSKSGEVLKILYPDGIKLDQYDDLLAVVRIVDFLFRISSGQKFSESPYVDIGGYAILGIAKDKGL